MMKWQPLKSWIRVSHTFLHFVLLCFFVGFFIVFKNVYFVITMSYAVRTEYNIFDTTLIYFVWCLRSCIDQDPRLTAANVNLLYCSCYISNARVWQPDLPLVLFTNTIPNDTRGGRGSNRQGPVVGLVHNHSRGQLLVVTLIVLKKHPILYSLWFEGCWMLFWFCNNKPISVCLLCKLE